MKVKDSKFQKVTIKQHGTLKLRI